MPTAMTFASLKTLVSDHIERGNLSDDKVYTNLPTLINNAERNIAIDLNVTGVRQVVTAALAAGVATYSKPDGWRRTTSFNIGTNTAPATSGFLSRQFLFPRSYEYCRAYWPDDTQVDVPMFYADYDDDHFLFSPTPALAHPFELIYFAKPTLLDDTSQTNWLTENWPQLLLYATLCEAAAFMKGYELIPVWQDKYAKLLSSVSSDDTKKIIDRSASRQEA